MKKFLINDSTFGKKTMYCAFNNDSCRSSYISLYYNKRWKLCGIVGWKGDVFTGSLTVKVSEPARMSPFWPIRVIEICYIHTDRQTHIHRDKATYRTRLPSLKIWNIDWNYDLWTELIRCKGKGATAIFSHKRKTWQNNIIGHPSWSSQFFGKIKASIR